VAVVLCLRKRGVRAAMIRAADVSRSGIMSGPVARGPNTKS
jgi:hypothetical protein